MKWIVVENFTTNLEEHLALIEAMAQYETIFLVRKEYVEFEELEEGEKQEIIEENYELFKEQLLWFYDETIKEGIQKKIIIKVEQMIGSDIDNLSSEIRSILNFIEKNEYTELLDQIKKAIMFGILEDRKKISLFHKENYTFTKKNQSYKYYSSNGLLENENKYFEWYKLENMKEMKCFIENNIYNYNIIIAPKGLYNKEYNYYINFYEGTKNILAVKDFKGNFLTIFKGVFKEQYIQ